MSNRPAKKSTTHSARKNSGVGENTMNLKSRLILNSLTSGGLKLMLNFGDISSTGEIRAADHFWSFCGRFSIRHLWTMRIPTFELYLGRHHHCIFPHGGGNAKRGC